MEKHIKEKFLGTLGAAIMFIAMLLPYENFGGFTRNLMSDFPYRGWLIFLLLVGVLFALTEVGIVQIVLGALGLIFSAFGYRAVMPTSELDSYLDIDASMLSRSWGSYVFLAGALCMLLGGVLCIWFHKKEREAYEAQEAENSDQEN